MELVPNFISGVRHTPKQRQRVPQQPILGVVPARLLRLVVCSPCCEGVTVRDDKDAGDGEEDGDEIEDPEERRGAEVGRRGEVVQREKVGPLCIPRVRRWVFFFFAAQGVHRREKTHESKDVVNRRDVCFR